MDIQVKEFQAPIITINYETLNAELDKFLEEYTGLVVTEQTLAGCKAAQKELASLRTKIDTYRKEKKKELEKPIKNFEAQCKDLIAKVERAEQPIKDGIKVYDDKTREEKRQTALKIIADVAQATGLNDKYTAKLDVLDKYMNLTATEKAVREDLETRAFALKVEQDREQERLDIIQNVIDSENERLNTKLSMADFTTVMQYASTTDVISEIKKRAQQIYEAENKPVAPPKEPQHTEMPPQAENKPETPQAQPQHELAVQMYKVTFEVVGSFEQQRAISAFLKANGITYTVKEQLKI